MEATDREGFVKVHRALLSVSDKQGIVDFAKKLSEHGVEIISTGGTKKVLKDAGVHVVPISSFTGAPEILGGRVKTLHPAVHGGILHKRSDPEHIQEVKEHDIRPIDMVVVNLYPFEQTVRKDGATDEDIIENIDIGGPSMVRSAAKNHESVTVVTDPSQYGRILDEMQEFAGSISYKTRFAFARTAFELTSRYDSLIASYFASKTRKRKDETDLEFPGSVVIEFRQHYSLRYGENPHQKACIYAEIGRSGPSLVDAQVLAGKALSYNNYNDIEAVLEMLVDFDEPFACVVKHTNPCGAAVADTVQEAYRLAYESDPMSAYGSIIGLNRVVDISAAELLHETPFVECILAPGYMDDALALMKKKKARRILALPSLEQGDPEDMFARRLIRGGLLLQQPDKYNVTRDDLEIVTEARPTDGQIESLLFAFRIVRHVKSNAIVLVQGRQLVGLGCGQTSRVDAAFLAAHKAGEKAAGSVLASDAFFPMRDGIDAAAEAGVSAIIQPGGSKRDDEAIEAANEHGITMVFTGVRHFKH